MSEFRFKKFSVVNDCSAMKVNTDGVLLGAMAPLPEISGETGAMAGSGNVTVLDIGTGTGTIALMLAQRLSEAGFQTYQITGIDIDGPSVTEAAANFESSPWPAHLTAVQQPLQSYAPSEKIDLIVSNPPYYDDSLRNPDERKADARHTASLSFREILQFASDHLSEEGRLALVLPSEVERELLRCARSWSIYPERLVRIHTTARKQPKRMVVTFSRRRADLSEEQFVMMEEGRYTSQYTALLGCFYINL